MDSSLPKNLSLQVLVEGQIVFENRGKWLFPLFDLEDHLLENAIDMKQAEVRDKVIGKAAALLILRMGALHVHGDVMSDLAIAVLDQAQMPYSYNERVPKIDCQTEEILADVNDMQAAYEILCQRAGRC